MVLDKYLCRAAEEKQGWSMSFGGNLRIEKDNIVTPEAWTPQRQEPEALLISSEYFSQNEQDPRSYGFLDITKNGVIYQEVGMVYPGVHQRNAFHRDLVTAIILHLRQLPEGIQPKVQLPEMLKIGVHPKHFEYLEANLKYHQPDIEGKRQCSRRCKHPYHKVEGYKTMQILDFDRQDIGAVLRSTFVRPQ